MSHTEEMPLVEGVTDSYILQEIDLLHGVKWAQISGVQGWSSRGAQIPKALALSHVEVWGVQVDVPAVELGVSGSTLARDSLPR